MKPRLIMVMGMHRSGTSCLTGLLGDAGVWLGPVEKGSPHNMKGNNENRQVMNLNKALLAANDASWKSPPPADARWDETQTERARELLADILADGRIAAMKDPRSLYTGRGWIREARAAGADVDLIGTFRRPERVTASLRARDPEMDEPSCRDLWCRYNERLLEFHDESRFPLLDFDIDADAYLAAVRIAFAALDLPRPEELSFFESGLRHHDNAFDLSEREASILAALRSRAIAPRGIG